MLEFEEWLANPLRAVFKDPSGQAVMTIAAKDLEKRLRAKNADMFFPNPEEQKQKAIDALNQGVPFLNDIK